MIKVVPTVCLNFNQPEDARSLQRVKDNFSSQSQSQILEPEIAEFLFKNIFCQYQDQEIGNGKYFCWISPIWKVHLLQPPVLLLFIVVQNPRMTKDKTLESVLEINIYLKVFKKFQNQRMTKDKTLKFILEINRYLKFVKTFQLFWKFFSGTMSDWGENLQRSKRNCKRQNT